MPRQPMTVKEIAAAMRIEPTAARSLIGFLCAVGIATDRGERPPTERRGGRGEKVYSIPDDMPARVAAIVKRLK